MVVTHNYGLGYRDPEVLMLQRFSRLSAPEIFQENQDKPDNPIKVTIRPLMKCNSPQSANF